MESPTHGAEGSRRLFPARAMCFLALIGLVEKTTTVMISTNLVTYLMDKQFYGVKKATILTNTLGGINPFAIALGAAIAHVYKGQRITIITASSLTYVVGLILIVLSVNKHDHVHHTTLFFCSIVVVCVASGVTKAYLESASSTQLDDHHDNDKNWWEILNAFLLFLLSASVGHLVRYMSWRYLYVTLLISMAIATGIFYGGRGVYRFTVPPQSPNVTGGTDWRMLSILWVTCMVFGIYKAQTPTFFMLQGGSMNRVIGHGRNELPTVVFVSISTIVAEFFVRVYQKLTKREGGNIVRRTNIDIFLGMFITMVGVLIAALVETKRLKMIAHTEEGSRVYGPIKMNAFWLLPQGVLLTIADGVILSGVTEQFKHHVPRSSSDLATAFHMSAIFIGSLLSGLFIDVADRISKCFGADVDHSRTDKFYWILFSVILLYLIVYLRFFVQIQIRATME